MGTYRAFYFGCWGDTGHFLWNSRKQSFHRYSDGLPNDFPVEPTLLDGTFIPPKAPKIEGLAHFSYVNGWSLIAFPDYSVDSRPGSNSVFLVSGQRSFEQTLALSKKSFPEIFNRFKFEIVLHQTTVAATT